MSDSLFLDPFAQPPSGEFASSTGRGAGHPPKEELAPLVAEIPLAAERAVEAFLEYIHLWWPDTLRTCGEDSHMGFEDGGLLEEGVDGSRHRWADVVGIDGASLALRWFGGARDQAISPADVSIEFAPESATLARLAVRASGPTSFMHDWRAALDGYARFTGGAVRPSAA